MPWLAQSSALENEVVKVKQIAMMWLCSYTVGSTKNPLAFTVKMQ